MGRARQIASSGNNDSIILDASAASTDVGERLLLDASAASTDVGFSILMEDDTPRSNSSAVGFLDPRTTDTGNVGVGTDRSLYVDTANELVGIGNTSPTSALHVVDDAGANIAIQSRQGSHWRLGDAVGSSNGNFILYDYTNSGIRVQVNSDGSVNLPAQPAFNATNNGTQSNIALATQVTVALGTERFDVNADFASDTFTAPVTGKYQLNAFMRFDNLDSAAHYYEFRILTSNSGYGIILDPDFGQDQAYFNMSLAVLADMDASDTAKVELRQEGGTQQTDILDARFSGFLAC